jgi:hypothetical protein
VNDQQEDAISVAESILETTRICGTLVKITSCDFLPHDSSCERERELYGCFSALRPHVSHLRPGLYCIVLYCIAYVLCVLT